MAGILTNYNKTWLTDSLSKNSDRKKNTKAPVFHSEEGNFNNIFDVLIRMSMSTKPRTPIYIYMFR